DTHRENGLHDPAILNQLERSVKFASDLHIENMSVGKAWTITAILKEIHQALNENRREFYAIPQDRKLVAQEFLLFENSGSDDLEDVVDTSFSKARFTLKSPFHDAMVYKVLLDTVKDHFKKNYPGVTITVTGVMALFTAIIHNVVTSMVKSYSYALSIITVLMMVLIGRVRIGMLSMVPNLVPIMVILGIMGWLGISFDLSTILIGSITIGIVVDDTIHFMHNFRRYVEETGDVAVAVRRTMLTTGRAMLITTVVLASGFFNTMLAEMKNTAVFGLLTGSAVVLALVADYFLAPALMTLVYRRKKDGRRGATEMPSI
ncbi:MAG TPA: Fis family transcriptional regulator, partial [Nitrospiraceae bacterium]|nr:Fis family transcriptional regulator [Nitrospiraceae bacterium]